MRKTAGLSLLLLIFLSLCLIIFSLLSLSGAAADETLSQKTADRTTAYYAAVSEANKLLAEVDTLLAEELRTILYTENSGPNTASALTAAVSYINNCITVLQSHFPDCLTFTENMIYLTFSVPVTVNQILQISLSVSYPVSPEDTLYQITGWQILNTDTWTPDLSQKVFIP